VVNQNIDAAVKGVLTATGFWRIIRQNKDTPDKEAGMIKNAGIGKEVVVVAENKIGLLNKISKLVADHAINIEGVAGYAADNQAKIMLVTSDATRAVEALSGAGFKSVKESEVIILELENKPGALRSVTDRLAAQNVDIKYLYGSACSGSCADKVILATSDNQKALVAFKKK